MPVQGACCEELCGKGHGEGGGMMLGWWLGAEGGMEMLKQLRDGDKDDTGTSQLRL